MQICHNILGGTKVPNELLEGILVALPSDPEQYGILEILYDSFLLPDLGENFKSRAVYCHSEKMGDVFRICRDASEMLMQDVSDSTCDAEHDVSAKKSLEVAERSENKIHNLSVRDAHNFLTNVQVLTANFRKVVTCWNTKKFLLVSIVPPFSDTAGPGVPSLSTDEHTNIATTLKNYRCKTILVSPDATLYRKHFEKWHVREIRVDPDRNFLLFKNY